MGEILSLAVPDEGMTSMEYLVEKAPGRRGIMHNTEVQTTHVEGSLSLEQKFAVMDLEFRRALEERKNVAVPVLQSKGDEEKKWYEKELHRFKEFEAHKVKLKVGEDWRVKFQDYAAHLEEDYRKRVDRLRKR